MKELFSPVLVILVITVSLKQDTCAGGAVINKVSEVCNRGFDAYLCSSGLGNGQTHWLSPANVRDGIIRFPHQDSSIVLSLYPNWEVTNVFLTKLGSNFFNPNDLIHS